MAVECVPQRSAEGIGGTRGVEEGKVNSSPEMQGGGSGNYKADTGGMH